jgi:hypothetical protein
LALPQSVTLTNILRMLPWSELQADVVVVALSKIESAIAANLACDQTCSANFLPGEAASLLEWAALLM